MLEVEEEEAWQEGALAMDEEAVMACDVDACLVEPPILRGRGLPRLVRRRVRRGVAGMGHAVWELGSVPATTPSPSSAGLGSKLG